MTKNRKNRHDRRPYIQRLYDFTQRVAEQTLPDGETFQSVFSTSFGPERIYKNIVRCESGRLFYIYFTYKEFKRGSLDSIEWNHDFR